MPASPRRRLPLDGQAPRDFVADGGEWPRGPFRSPWTPAERQALGLTERTEHAYVGIVAGLAADVVRYKAWLRANNTTSEAVSRRLQVSRSRISALVTGARFPTWDLAALIRELIADPPAPEPAARRPVITAPVKKTHVVPPNRSPRP